MEDKNKIRDAADAIKGVVEAVPIYQDLVQPAAREVGTALKTAAKTLHILLAPVSGLVWGYDKIKDFVERTVAEKLEGIPEDRLKTPEPHIAGPVLEALKYTGYQPSLREMYAGLLATSIDSETATMAHPSFVEIIRQMSPDEALMMDEISMVESFPKIDVRSEEKSSRLGVWALRNFSLIPKQAGCSCPELGSSYLINLQRLGLIELREKYKLKPDDGADIYQSLENAPEIQFLKKMIENEQDRRMSIIPGSGLLTPLGKQFCFACIYDGTHIK